MADQKISAMPSAATLTGAELVPLVQSGANVKTTLSTLHAFNLNHGAWQDNTTQSGSTVAGVPFTFNTTDVADGVTLVSGSQLTVPVDGVYNIQWSGQFQNLDVAPQDAIIWLKIDGTDVVGSAGKVGLSARKNPSDPFHGVFGWNYFLSLTAGQYVELYWYKTSANITLPAYAASTSPVYPSTASVIVTVNQVG